MSVNLIEIPVDVYLMQYNDVVKFWIEIMKSANLVSTLSLIMSNWPSDDVYHLRNRLYICLIGIASPEFLSNRIYTDGYKHKNDLSGDPKSWPTSLQGCLIKDPDTYNIYYNLENRLGYTWPK